MPRLLNAYVEHHTPAWASDAGPEGTRRAHLILWFGLLMESQALVFGILYLVLGLPGPALTLAVPGLLLVPLPRVLAYDATLATHWLCLLVVAALDGLAWWTGGVAAPGLWWTVILPALATLASGRSAGVVWVGICAANVVGVAVLHASGVDGHNVLPESTVAPVIAMGITMLGFAVWALARVHETTRVEMVHSVAEMNADLRRVLDNVGQGFVVVDPRGSLGGGMSAVLQVWFGPPMPGQALWTWLGGADLRFSGWLELAWQAVFDGYLPADVAIDQLPRRLERDGRSYALAWRPVGDPPTEIVLIASDVTAEMVARHAERVFKERGGLIERLRRDPVGVVQFVEEGDKLLDEIAFPSGEPTMPLHTLKGNAAVFGAQSIADLCHGLETSLLKRNEPLEPAAAAELRCAWEELVSPTREILRDERARVHLSTDDFLAFEQAVAERAPHEQLAAMLHSWREERTADALTRLAERARGVAERLGKPIPTMVVADHGLRVDPGRWSSLWLAMIHAVRNAIDHGIEPAEERVAAGKSAVATLRFATERKAGAMIISVADDGRGVDWARVAAVAAARGLPNTSMEDLQAALFASGVSTCEVANEMSGRGVGLGALREAARALGGELSIHSTTGMGTTVCVVVPETAPRRRAA